MREPHYRRRVPRDLTERQLDVLRLIARGKTNSEIAAALGITLDGAKAHVSVLLTKLEVASREEAAELWRSRGATSVLRDLLARATVPGIALKLGAGGAVVAAAALAIAVLVTRGSDEGDSLRELGLIEPPDRPSPFHATYVLRGPAYQREFPSGLGEIAYEGWYRDDDTWRVEFDSRAPGQSPGGRDIALLAGGQLSRYDAAENVHSASPAGTHLADSPSRWLRWESYTWPLPGGGSLATRDYLSQHCAPVGNQPVAGRDARHFVCGAAPALNDVWVDAAEGWLLKWIVFDGALPTPTPGDGGLRGNSFEVLTIEFNPRFAPDTFRFSPPSGSVTQEEDSRDPARHSRLKLGEAAPAWSAVRPDGTRLSSTDIGRPAIYLFIASWCDAACDVVDSFAASAASWKGTVHFVVVAIGEQSDAPKLPLPPGPQDYLVLATRDDSDWDVEGVPYWVALDSQGAVQELGIGKAFAGQEDRIAAGLARR